MQIYYTVSDLITLSKEEFLFWLNQCQFPNSLLIATLEELHQKNHIFVDDPDIILASLIHCEDIFQFASNRLKEDKQFILSNITGSALHYISKDLTKDREMISHMIKNCSFALSYISPELRKDKSIALEAVNYDGNSLHYLDDFKNDKEIVYQAISQNLESLMYASKELLSDKKFILDIIHNFKDKNSYEIFPLLSNLADDIDIIFALSPYEDIFPELSEKYTSNKDLVLATIPHFPSALNFVSAEITDDEQLAQLMLEINGNILEYLSPRLTKNRNIVLTAVNQDGASLVYASDDFRDDKEIAILSLRDRWSSYTYLSPRLQNDKEIITLALNHYPYLLSTLSEEHQNDKDLLLILREKTTAKHLSKTTPNYNRWFEERMNVLSIMEDEKWMKENIEPVKKSIMTRKF